MISDRRVVVTGIGVVAPNGHTLDTFWESLCAGRSAAGRLTRFDATGMPSDIAAEVRDLPVGDYVEPKTAARLDRSIIFALVAAKKAVADGAIKVDELNPDRIGVVEGTSVSGLESTLGSHQDLLKKGYRAVKPSKLITAYCGGGSSAIALDLGLQGQATTICTACSSGNDALAHAYREIVEDQADVMIAGAAEAPIVQGYYSIFLNAGVLSRSVEEPTAAMKPFDANRNGFVLGEGAAFFVLEERHHAMERGARIYAEVAGFGRSCDAHHEIALHPEGRGTRRAIELALLSGRVPFESVHYVNAHGSATMMNDAIETLALKSVFRDYARRLAISATKPITGHLAGACAALESAICVLAIHHQVMPPTINLKDPQAECDLDYIQEGARPFPVEGALNLNSGFGGKQTAVVFRRHSTQRAGAP